MNRHNNLTCLGVRHVSLFVRHAVLQLLPEVQVRHAREIAGPDVPILFTPNFCHVDEYVGAFDAGASVTVDGPDILLASPEVRC